jgi:CRP-like cAMP-binding protein
MVKPMHQPDVSFLSKATNGLLYLTANDWALIADKASRQQYKAGDQIVQRGRRTHGIYVILTGTAAVQIAGPGSATGIGPGEVCGEISFLDELPASANVVASDSLEAFYLDRPLLQSLFELYPHLGSRFYHSLSSILAHRLREMIGVPALETARDTALSKKNSK